MGSNSGGARLKGSRKAVACSNLFWVGVLPFVLGLTIIFTFYKAGPFSLHHSRNRRLREGQPAARNSACPQPDVCNCTTALANQTDLKDLEGALTKSSLSKVLDAANSTDPQEQTVRINEDVLPKIFLFVGVLSGRGYRFDIPLILHESCT